MKIFIIILFFLSLSTANAQYKYAKTEESEKLYSDAKVYLQRNDTKNAILVLKNLCNVEPDNIYFKRDLAATYLAINKTRSAEMVIEDCLKLDNASEECYMLGVAIYSKLDNFKIAKKVVQEGLSKFNTSAVLWNVKGELFYNFNKNAEAIKAWEQCIQVNPNNSQLFYNLANYYSRVEKNPLKASIHAEIFLNMESFTSRSLAMKNIIYNGYKELALQAFEEEEEIAEKSKNNTTVKSDFEGYLITKLKQNKVMILNGFNLEDILNWRTAFLNDILKDKKFDYNLFIQYEKINTKGHWDNYNRWIFAQLDNATAFTNWVKANGPQYDSFLKFIQEEKTKPQPNEFYFNLN
jgi:predicted Zn-dependent protease